MARIADARRVYVDTSAYLCVLLSEKGHDAIARETEGAELLSSVLLVLEARRNLTRLAREGAISADHYQACLEHMNRDVEQFSLRDLTLDICVSPDMPVVSTPRSLDLVHLRTALWFHRERALDRFLTQDSTQAAAAREMGLPAVV